MREARKRQVPNRRRACRARGRGPSRCNRPASRSARAANAPRAPGRESFAAADRDQGGFAERATARTRAVKRRGIGATVARGRIRTIDSRQEVRRAAITQPVPDQAMPRSREPGKSVPIPTRLHRQRHRVASRRNNRDRRRRQLENPSGKEPGANGEAAPKQPPDSTQNPSPSAGAESEGATQGLPTGGGVPGEGQATNADPSSEVPDSGQADLDYARRTTDMVLEYLSQQESKPDPRLLDELGWTAEDLQRFLQRWRQLKESAREAADGQRELDETLRSLGLRSPRDEVRRRKSPRDDLRGLRDSGLRSSPPPQYLEQFDAFKKGTARTGVAN